MLELIILSFIFWVGYQIGGMVTSYRLRHIIFREAKRVGIITEEDNDLFENTKPKVPELVVEKANNILYLYNKNDDTFVCQGSTLEELATLAMKYKNIKYAAVWADKEIYAFVDGTVKSEQEVLK